MNQWEYNTIPLLLVPPELGIVVSTKIYVVIGWSGWSSNIKFKIINFYKINIKVDLNQSYLAVSALVMI